MANAHDAVPGSVWESRDILPEADAAWQRVRVVSVQFSPHLDPAAPPIREVAVTPADEFASSILVDPVSLAAGYDLVSPGQDSSWSTDPATLGRKNGLSVADAKAAQEFVMALASAAARGAA